MTLVKEEEMYSIKGGAARWGVYATMGAFATFVAGFIDGFVHLKKCNK